jgi:DHA2 family multidrug resistance protein
VGTSVAQTVLERRQQFHTLRLNEKLDSLNPAVNQLFQQGGTFFLRHTGDAPLSRQMTLQALQNMRDQQALSLSYFDVFWCSAAVGAVLVFFVLLMRRSVAEKGSHVSAE